MSNGNYLRTHLNKEIDEANRGYADAWERWLKKVMRRYGSRSS